MGRIATLPNPLMRRASLCLFLCGAALAAHAAEITVFAAASLSDALKEVAKAYTEASGDKLFFNLGASSELALQIKNGAPADVFLSADEPKMDDLAKAGLLVADTRFTLLSNSLVVVVNVEGSTSLKSPEDLAGPAIHRLAIGEWHTVPAGIYAKEWLLRAHLWGKVLDRLVPSANVRGCLATVESGFAEAGIVYKTDALISKKVKIVYEVPVWGGPKISYPVAVMKAARSPDATRKFAAFLAGHDAAAIFKRYGFLPAP